MRVEILGQERRRRWRDEQKREIVMSVGVSGATVTEVAHRHHVTRQQIYTWRSELKKKGLLSPSTNAVFIPVDMSAVQTEQYGDQQHRSGMIELRLPRGRSLCFDSGVTASVLTRLIRAVEAA
ncbi:IS66-like element accessory protein TnpA [Sinorhizobium prairiense]|uniref:IS66-like element accessory protein TnpA n=1 Tax=unclassified Sinorhizobium TaxID=2613772 RepID=UPI0023D7DCE1|nr:MULTISPECIES: transposase [unclassified Sinorhizobium]WEJ11740.1 transposase [Sinorhizobium sp. M103]WEJ17604.1 transposase [Sinorhizobium sp. K101]WEJ40445.1 transposase [Sinorhizobium sp. C101]